MEISLSSGSNAKTLVKDRKGNLAKLLSDSSLKDHIIPYCNVGGRETSDPWGIEFEEGKFDINCDLNDRKIFYKNDSIQNSKWDVLHLARQTLDYQNANMGLISLHASSISYEGKGKLIFGDSGSGKTAIALQALKEGYSFFGNESSIVSKDSNLIGGTSLIVADEKMIDNFFEDLNDLGFSPVDGVRAIHPKEICGHNEKATPCAIDYIVKPKLGGSYEEVEYKENVLREDLYESSSRFISGMFLVNGLNEPCPINLDFPDLRDKRYRSIDNLVNNSEALKIGGNLKEILSRIKD